MKDKEENPINPRERLFCFYYLFGNDQVEPKFRRANPGMSYSLAYQKKFSEQSLNSSRTSASRLLRKDKIKILMREMLDEAGFNNEAVDSRLLEIITTGEDKDSNTAIREFNTIVGRRVEKHEHKIDAPVTTIIVNPIPDKKIK